MPAALFFNFFVPKTNTNIDCFKKNIYTICNNLILKLRPTPMINNKKLHFILAYAILIHCTSIIAIPDFFWIGYGTKCLWNKLPKFSFGGWWLTKKEAAGHYDNCNEKMRNRWINVNLKIDEFNENERQNVVTQFENAHKDCNIMFKNQHEKIVNLGKDVDNAQRNVVKNNSLIDTINQTTNDIKIINQGTQQGLTILKGNAQKTNLLFKENEKEHVATRKNCDTLANHNKFLKIKYKALYQSHKNLQGDFKIVVGHNDTMKNNIESLKEIVTKEQKTITFLKQYIQKNLNSKTTSSLPIQFFNDTKTPYVNITSSN